MLRLIINTLLAMVLAFAGTSVGVVELFLFLNPSKPGEWGGEVVLLFFALICGIVTAIVGGIATFKVGLESMRAIDRWDLVGWMVGLLSGVALSTLISSRYLFLFRCLITGMIITALMLAVPPLIRLWIGDKQQKEIEFD